jgi:hypothetical protein
MLASAHHCRSAAQIAGTAASWLTLPQAANLLPSLNACLPTQHWALRLCHKCRSAPWPDILFLDASVWHVFTSNNMSDYTRQLTSLLGFLKTKVLCVLECRKLACSS